METLCSRENNLNLYISQPLILHRTYKCAFLEDDKFFANLAKIVKTTKQASECNNNAIMFLHFQCKINSNKNTYINVSAIRKRNLGKCF